MRTHKRKPVEPDRSGLDQAQDAAPESRHEPVLREPVETEVPAEEAEPGAVAEPAPPPASKSFDRYVARIRLWFIAAWAWIRRAPHAVWHYIRHLSRLTQGIIAAVILILVAVILFLAQPNWDWARPMVASIISGKVHRPVAINGHLRVHLFSFTPSATLQGLRIGEPDWVIAASKSRNLADVEAINVKVELMPLFVGRIVLPRLQVDRPNVVLFQAKDGRANWDFSNGADKGKPLKLPTIKNFIITDGRLSVTSLQRRMSFTGTINAHEKADAGGQAFALTGEGSLNGNRFMMRATGGPLLNVRSTVPYPFDMDVRSGPTHLTAKGRVIHPFDLGQLEGTVTVSGSNLADLYDITGLALPNTPRYSIAAQVVRTGRVYDIDRINGRIGGSDLEGKLKVDTRTGRPNLTGDLRSRLLDFKDLGSLFGATSANAPQAVEVSMAPQAAAPYRRLLPDVPLDIQRVRGMDAKVHYRALSVKAIATMPLREVSLGVTLDHGLLTLDPIAFSFPQGHLTGTARIDARTDVQKNTVDMRLTGVRIQDFVPKIGGSAPLEGTLNARVRASGTGSTVHQAASTADGQLTLVMPSGTIRQTFAELLGVNATKGLFLLLSKDPHQTEVRCGLADFNIRNGTLQSQSIVFDTDVVRVNGGGAITLNDERMKFTLQGKPKKFRLTHINAPVVVGGHLTAPKVGIDPKAALVQGGLAAAFNTVLPFLNIDYAKDANCGALMSEARAQGAATTRAAPAKSRKGVK